MTRSFAHDSDICETLEAGLSEQLGEKLRIVRLERRQYEYRSSCALEEVNFELADGRSMTVLFKDFSPQSMLQSTRNARQECLYDPAREILVYTKLLAKLQLRSAKACAFKLDFVRKRFWLFLEKVAGRELYQFAELTVWEAAARWLARFHRSAQGIADNDNLHLLSWDRSCYQTCLERASLFQSTPPSFRGEIRGSFHQIATAYSAVAEELLAGPRAIIHGEFYASNVLVVESADEFAICPIDWETAGSGPPLIDLAALVAGRWSDQQRGRMVQAYWHALEDAERKTWKNFEQFMRSLLGCRLHLAIQMLGRPPEWQPPAEHKHDWYGEAMELTALLQQDADDHNAAPSISA